MQYSSKDYGEQKHPVAHLCSKQHVVPQVVHQKIFREFDDIVTAMTLLGNALIHDLFYDSEQFSLTEWEEML